MPTVSCRPSLFHLQQAMTILSSVASKKCNAFCFPCHRENCLIICKEKTRIPVGANQPNPLPYPRTVIRSGEMKYNSPKQCMPSVFIDKISPFEEMNHFYKAGPLDTRCCTKIPHSQTFLLCQTKKQLITQGCKCLKSSLPILTLEYPMWAEGYSSKPRTKQLALTTREALKSLAHTSLGKHTHPTSISHTMSQAVHPTSCCLLKQDVPIAWNISVLEGTK